MNSKQNGFVSILTVYEDGTVSSLVRNIDIRKNRLYFEQFAYANDEFISEEKYKNFDELIEFLDAKDYTTLKVVTKPRV